MDCNRGTQASFDPATGQTEYRYKEGCCKLRDHNYLKGIPDNSDKSLFEVRFKNTRKGIYRNASGQNLALGDLVIVEAATGSDLGIVTLEGALVEKQMRLKGIDADSEFKRIYRRARQTDIDKWQEAISRETETMIQARRIAAEMGLDMKIGDVEFQGDGSKAIFYYIAEGRVDFRQLIKVFAEEFAIRIEMKQIGARQEAGLIGGIGVCGRELCCAGHISHFKSISTAAARVQDLTLNPQKLAGQCGKLKCCLNYEVAAYQDAASRIPRVQEPLEFEDGPAYLRKVDILAETLYFSYDKTSDTDLHPLSAGEVADIISMNRRGVRPQSLKSGESVQREFVDAVGDESVSRFDAPRRRRKNHPHGKGKNNRK